MTGQLRADLLRALGTLGDDPEVQARAEKVYREGKADSGVLASAIAVKSPAAVALGKRAFYAQVEMGLESAYALAGETMACNMLEPDAAEGIDAFLGKRHPRWRSP